MNKSFIKLLILLIIICTCFNIKINAFSDRNCISKQLNSQINNYNIADKIVESLYDIKSNFIGLNEDELKQLTPQNYLSTSLQRSKQFANEVLCLRNLFSNFNLSKISKEEARKRVNNITEDVIKYRQGIYQKIMIEKVYLDTQTWRYMSNSMDEIKNTTNTIQESLKRIRLN